MRRKLSMAVVAALVLFFATRTAEAQCVDCLPVVGSELKGCVPTTTGSDSCTLIEGGKSCTLSGNCPDSGGEGGGGGSANPPLNVDPPGLRARLGIECGKKTVDCFGDVGFNSPGRPPHAIVPGPELMSALFMRNAAADFLGVSAEDVAMTHSSTTLSVTAARDWKYGEQEWISVSEIPVGNKVRVLICQGGEPSSPGRGGKANAATTHHSPPRLVVNAILGWNDVLIAPVSIDGVRQLFVLHAKPALSSEQFTADYLTPQQMNFHQEARTLPVLRPEPIITRSGDVHACGQVENP